MAPRAADIWADGPSSSPNEPPKEQIRKWGTDIENRLDSIQIDADSVTKATWAELAAVEGTRDGQRGLVPNSDTGTHTDPVVGGTVPNGGTYAWVAAGPNPVKWQRVDAYQDVAGLTAEMVAARGDEDTLGDRLDDADADTAALKDVTANLFNTAEVSPRDEVRFPFAFEDGDGRMVAAFDRYLGALAVSLLAWIVPSDSPRNRPQVALPLLDGEDRVLAGFEHGGGLRVGGLTLVARQVNPRGAPFALELVKVNDKVAIGLRHDGRVEIALGADTIADIAARLNVAGLSYISPDVLGLPAEVIAGAPRPLADGSYILPVTDHGERIDVRLVANDAPLGLTVTTGPVDVVIGIGQSKMGAPFDNGLATNKALFPHTVLAFEGKAYHYASSVASDGAFGALRALTDDAPDDYGTFPLSVAAWAEDQFDADAGLKRPGRLVFTSWEGGKPLDNFVSGTNSFTNVGKFCTFAKTRLHETYERGINCSAIVFDQGESGRNANPDAAVAFNRAGYVADFAAYAASQRSAVETATGQAGLPDMLFVQIAPSAWYADPENGLNNIRLAQLDVHETETAGLLLALPDYPHPMGDGIHRTLPGTLMFGETVGYVRHLRRRGLFTGPVRPTLLERSGANVDITFHIPPTGGALAWDADWIDGTGIAATKGFKVRLASDNTPLTISSVTFVGSNKVRITLSADPGAGVIVSYAISTHTATGSGAWALGRGLLMSQSSQQSTFNRLGFAVPSNIRFYAVGFEKEI